MLTIVNKVLSLTIVYRFDYEHKNCRFWKHDRLKKKLNATLLNVVYETIVNETTSF